MKRIPPEDLPVKNPAPTVDDELRILTKESAGELAGGEVPTVISRPAPPEDDFQVLLHISEEVARGVSLAAISRDIEDLAAGIDFHRDCIRKSLAPGQSLPPIDPGELKNLPNRIADFIEMVTKEIFQEGKIFFDGDNHPDGLAVQHLLHLFSVKNGGGNLRYLNAALHGKPDSGLSPEDLILDFFPVRTMTAEKCLKDFLGRALRILVEERNVLMRSVDHLGVFRYRYRPMGSASPKVEPQPKIIINPEQNNPEPSPIEETKDLAICPLRLEPSKTGWVAKFLGLEKEVTPSDYNVLKQIVDVYPGGLSKDELNSKCNLGDARKTLDRLIEKDGDWEKIIGLAGKAWQEGYRILSS